MKKINVLWTVLNTIFLILFNTLFYVLGGSSHKASVWISYGFIHFAYFMLLVTPLLVRKYKNAAIFGYPLLSISSAYFMLQFVVGLIFVLLALNGFKTALSVQLCIAGLYGILLTVYMLANEYTADAEEKRQSEITFVKNATLKIKSILENITDRDLKNKIEKVYDVINSSPVKSHNRVFEAENRILHSIGELEKAVSLDDKEKIITIADLLIISVNERNAKLKSLN